MLLVEPLAELVYASTQRTIELDGAKKRLRVDITGHIVGDTLAPE